MNEYTLLKIVASIPPVSFLEIVSFNSPLAFIWDYSFSQYPRWSLSHTTLEAHYIVLQDGKAWSKTLGYRLSSTLCPLRYRIFQHMIVLWVKSQIGNVVRPEERLCMQQGRFGIPGLSTADGTRWWLQLSYKLHKEFQCLLLVMKGMFLLWPDIAFLCPTPPCFEWEYFIWVFFY